MKLLTLNGGGTAGYASCLLLSRLEDETHLPCTSMFDLIHGVSTGSIIAAALSIGLSTDVITRLYQNEIPEIFKKSFWPPWKGLLGGSKYDHEHLQMIADAVFDNRTMMDVRAPLMIHALQISPVVCPTFWKSWKTESTRVRIADAVVASCSAPTFFPPKDINERVYVDGGMCANNPSHCTIVEAIKSGAAPSDITVLNIQLGEAPRFELKQAMKMKSLVNWAPKLVKVMLSSNVEIAEYLSNNMIDNYINVDFNFHEPLDYWSDAYKFKCERMVDQYWAANKSRIVDSVMGCKTATARLTKSSATATTKKYKNKNDEGTNGTAANYSGFNNG
jgi:patatin-like phospholipase/acyl hydrolase